MAEEYSLTQVDDYLHQLYADDDPVRQEMEELARQRRFPIVGPIAGRHLYQLARMIGAQRIFELGSGFGYSALYFGRAIGPQGEIHCTELDAENIRLAEMYLSGAGVWPRITYHQEEATGALRRIGGVWDIIYNDVDKAGYPATIDLAYRHLRPGGLFITDNLLWHGRIFNGATDADTQGVVEFTRQLFAHPGFISSIYPEARDGLAVALRL